MEFLVGEGACSKDFAVGCSVTPENSFLKSVFTPIYSLCLGPYVLILPTCYPIKKKLEII